MEGFLTFDYLAKAPEAVMQLFSWVQAGEIVSRVDVEEGLENAPRALRRLFTGDNFGKQLLKVAD
jgi:NADPH-dependent curcumin reductase CurA